MATDPLSEQPNPATAVMEWLPMPPTDLVFDDGEPLETNRHRIAMNLLIRSLKQGWSARSDSFVGGNMFVYYSSQQVRNREFRGPDFFVVLGVDPDPSRLGWVVWEEGGRYPDLIVELLSASTREIDRGAKKTLYEQVFRTRDYIVFDPFEPGSLEGWHLNLDSLYQPILANSQGWLWCRTLNLWLGPWQGPIEGDTCTWLRFYDPAGNLVLLPEESAQQQLDEERQRTEQERQRAEQERQRADRLAERLRQLGVDPDQG